MDREILYTVAKWEYTLILPGHNYKNGLTYEGKDNKLPVVSTCNGSQTFDLCFVDYYKEVLSFC